jgi:hypothetical protein
VRTQVPDVADLADRRRAQSRYLVFIREPCSGRIERRGQLLGGEAQQREVGAECRQVLELKMQHLEVPAGVHRDPVVGEHQLAALKFGQADQLDDRHFLQAELPRGGETTMARYDVAIVSNQDRVGEPKRPDAAGDLGDLRVTVRARVVCRAARTPDEAVRP